MLFSCFILGETRVNILVENAYLLPLGAYQVSLFSPSNLNFGVIPPSLEKTLNLAPLKCLEMPSSRPNMWKLGD